MEQDVAEGVSMKGGKMLQERWGNPRKEMGAVGLSVNHKPGKHQSQWEIMRGYNENPIKSLEWLFEMQIKVVRSM